MSSQQSLFPFDLFKLCSLYAANGSKPAPKKRGRKPIKDKRVVAIALEGDVYADIAEICNAIQMPIASYLRELILQAHREGILPRSQTHHVSQS